MKFFCNFFRFFLFLQMFTCYQVIFQKKKWKTFSKTKTSLLNDKYFLFLVDFFLGFINFFSQFLEKKKRKRI